MRTFRYTDITEGQIESNTYQITPGILQHFIAAFRDDNPVHIDEAYAKSRGFAGQVMHGAILNGFISNFIGTWFPGRFSLELAVDVRFSKPCYLSDFIQLEAVVGQKMDAKKLLILDVTLKNLTQKNLAGRGRVQVMVFEED